MGRLLGVRPAATLHPLGVIEHHQMGLAEALVLRPPGEDDAGAAFGPARLGELVVQRKEPGALDILMLPRSLTPPAVSFGHTSMLGFSPANPQVALSFGAHSLTQFFPTGTPSSRKRP